MLQTSHGVVNITHNIVTIIVARCPKHVVTQSIWSVVRCNRLQCPRLDCPPACKLHIRVIITPYRLIL